MRPPRKISISKFLGFQKKTDAKKVWTKILGFQKNPDAKKVWTKILGFAKKTDAKKVWTSGWAARKLAESSTIRGTQKLA